MTIQLTIPGRGDLTLTHLALDVNGTLACDGVLVEGVVQRLQELRQRLQPHVLTADTFGLAAQVQAQLDLPLARVRSGAEKLAFVQRLGVESVAAIGNGANDAAMLEAAALGIAVLGPEGLARPALLAADLIAPNPLAALDLLLYPSRLIATLRC